MKESVWCVIENTDTHYVCYTNGDAICNIVRIICSNLALIHGYKNLKTKVYAKECVACGPKY